MLEHAQFVGSSSKDADMHLHNFSELCNMTRIKDYDLDVPKLRLFPFSLRGEVKQWFLLCLKVVLLPRMLVAAIFLSKFCPPAIIQSRYQITG